MTPPDETPSPADAPPEAAATLPEAAGVPTEVAAPAATAAQAASAVGAARRRLPPHLQSLLSIEVPLCVTLAEKKQLVSQILAIGPGSILQFDKACDELLDLEVGGQRIARGEAVKVGDKFGLRIATLAVPRPSAEPPGGGE